MSFRTGKNFVFTVTTLAKVSTAASTIGQAIFVVVMILNIKLRRSVNLNLFIFYVAFIFIVSVNALINGFSVYSAKNLIYVFLAPYVLFYQNFFSGPHKYLSFLFFSTICWYLIEPSSYLTLEFGSFPRFAGPFINANVAGLSMLLLIIYLKNQPVVKFMKFICLVLLVYGVYLTQSKTAWILLPICFLKKKHILWYLGLLILIAIYLFISFDLRRFLPSLFSRFSLWSTVSLGDFSFFGSGFDTFGAGIGTLTSTSILIIDSFYISAFLSGGITYLVLTVTFFFIMPFLKCHRNDALIAPSVAVMSIACTSGNFLENGFPANIIFLAIIMQKSRIGAKVVG